MQSSVECFNWHAELSAVEALASARNFCPALPPGTVWWGGSDALASRGLCAEDAVCRVHLKTPFAVERKRRCASVAASNISMAHILWRYISPL